MSFRFRFPIAILNYLDNGGTEGVMGPEFARQNAIEKAREFAERIEPEKRKRPTLEDAEAWVQEIVTERDRQRAEKNER
jgi:hypothetical protein